MKNFNLKAKLSNLKLGISKRFKQFLNENPNVKERYYQTGKSIVVNKLIPPLNTFVRHLVEVKGLNPDVLPQAPQPQLKDLKDLFNKKRLQVPFDPSWVKESFSNLSKHPILKSRADYQNKVKNPPKADVMINEEPLFPTLEQDLEAFSQMANDTRDLGEVSEPLSQEEESMNTALQMLQDTNKFATIKEALETVRRLSSELAEPKEDNNGLSLEDSNVDSETSDVDAEEVTVHEFPEPTKEKRGSFRRTYVKKSK